ncbi:unnamed protein product [Leuciscus chuanchicus]
MTDPKSTRALDALSSVNFTEFDILSTQQAEYLLSKSRHGCYEHGEKIGRILAHQLRQRTANQAIPAINDEQGSKSSEFFWKGIPQTRSGCFKSPVAHSLEPCPRCNQEVPFACSGPGGGVWGKEISEVCGCCTVQTVMGVQKDLIFYAEDPGSTILHKLELLEALARDSQQECVTVIQPGGDKGMDELLCS